jgi:hypothetical protein
MATRVFAVVLRPDEAAESQPRVWSMGSRHLNRPPRHQLSFKTLLRRPLLLPAEIAPTVDRMPLYKCKGDTHMRNQLLRLFLSISVTLDPDRWPDTY